MKEKIKIEWNPDVILAGACVGRKTMKLLRPDTIRQIIKETPPKEQS